MRNLKIKKAFIALLTAGTIITGVHAYNNSKPRKKELEEPIRGCDISEYQVYINWDELNSNFDYVILRAASGDKIDTNFEDNYLKAKANNMEIGIYYYNAISKKTSADLEEFKKTNENRIEMLLSNLKNKDIKWPVYLDIEYKLQSGETLENYLPKEYAETLLNTFNKKITEAGLISGIYTNKSTYDYLNDKVQNLNNRFEIWVAGGENYNTVTTLAKTTNKNKNFNENIKMVQSYDHVVNAGAGNETGHLDVDYSYIDYSDRNIDSLGCGIAAGMGTLSLAGIISLGNKKIKNKEKFISK